MVAPDLQGALSMRAGEDQIAAIHPDFDEAL
jgi:hypothetical protein